MIDGEKWAVVRFFGTRLEALQWQMSGAADYTVMAWPDEDLRVHPPGQCSDRLYGSHCSGIATWGPDPFQADVNSDPTPVWGCDGAREGSAMDI